MTLNQKRTQNTMDHFRVPQRDMITISSISISLGIFQLTNPFRSKNEGRATDTKPPLLHSPQKIGDGLGRAGLGWFLGWFLGWYY